MANFSIEIITKGEKSLEETLESIRRQSYNSFEIVCANSSSDARIIKILDDYSVKHLEVGPVKHLRGRAMAHDISRGKFSLIMDSTRLLAQDALEVLQGYTGQYDMIAIREGSIGKGFWVNQANIYKNITELNSDSEEIRYRIPSYILPRLYKRDVLTGVFRSLRNKMPETLFDSIGYGEHHIMFQEALSLTKSFYYYKEKELILHFEDSSLRTIYRKYKSYGKDQIKLKSLPNYNASHLATHARKLNKYQIMAGIRCLPIISARTISFLIGLLL